ASDNNIDNNFNHDQDGNPIASDNNIDNNFNHDQDGNPIASDNNINNNFNHDQDGDAIVANKNADVDFNHDAVGQPIHANNQAMISRSMQQSHDTTTPQSAITTHHQSNSLPATGQDRTRAPYIGFVITLVLGVAFILLRKSSAKK
ncbi:hypothetical protein QP661_11360, partial [Staphylococcus warneri]|nr:hypothetical protein [Staphylococcus warneri]